MSVCFFLTSPATFCGDKHSVITRWHDHVTVCAVRASVCTTYWLLDSAYTKVFTHTAYRL